VAEVKLQLTNNTYIQTDNVTEVTETYEPEGYRILFTDGTAKRVLRRNLHHHGLAWLAGAVK
jgi:hypothetical protein